MCSRLTSGALYPGVTSEPDGTGATGLMQARLADGVSTAGIYRACVPAGALDTLVWVSAVSISDAGGLRCH